MLKFVIHIPLAILIYALIFAKIYMKHNCFKLRFLLSSYSQFISNEILQKQLNLPNYQTLF